MALPSFRNEDSRSQRSAVPWKITIDVTTNMQTQLPAMLVYLFLVTMVTVQSAPVDITIGQHWSGGFSAKACVPVTLEHHGWKIKLTFNMPLTSLEAYNADIAETLDGGNTYILSNKQWNADEHSGDEFCADLQGHMAGDQAPKGTAVIIGEENATPRSTTTTAAPTERITSPTTTETPTTHVLTASKLTLQFEKQWNGGFSAQPCFTLPYELHGWSARVELDTPVKNLGAFILDVNETLDEGRTFILVNKEWNPDFEVRHTICPLVHVNTEVAPSGTMEILGGTNPSTTLETRVPPLTAGPTVAGGDTKLTVINVTGNYLTGDLFLPVVKNMTGWMANITFSEPVTHLEVDAAVPFSRSPDFRHWVVVSKTGNTDLVNGTVLVLHLVTTHQGDVTPEVTGRLIDLQRQ